MSDESRIATELAIGKAQEKIREDAEHARKVSEEAAREALDAEARYFDDQFSGPCMSRAHIGIAKRLADAEQANRMAQIDYRKVTEHVQAVEKRAEAAEVEVARLTLLRDDYLTQREVYRDETITLKDEVARLKNQADMWEWAVTAKDKQLLDLTAESDRLRAELAEARKERDDWKIWATTAHLDPEQRASLQKAWDAVKREVLLNERLQAELAEAQEGLTIAFMAGEQRGREARDAVWLKHAEAIRIEGVENFENPMLALSARVALEDCGGDATRRENSHD